MKLLAMNCPNCNGKLQAGEKSGYLTCEHCGSNIMIRKEDSDLPDDSDKEERLNLLLDSFQLNISNYKAKGILDPSEILSIKKNFYDVIMDLSPNNKRAKQLWEKLTEIEFDYIGGNKWSLKLKQDGFLLITDNNVDKTIYEQPLEKVVILDCQEPIPSLPILEIPIPGKIVFQNPDDPAGKTIDFLYPDDSDSEVRRLFRFISKVVQVPG